MCNNLWSLNIRMVTWDKFYYVAMMMNRTRSAQCNWTSTTHAILITHANPTAVSIHIHIPSIPIPSYSTTRPSNTHTESFAMRTKEWYSMTMREARQELS